MGTDLKERRPSLVKFEIKNPRVDELLKQALKAAREFWVGLMSGDKLLFNRKGTCFDQEDGVHFNINEMQWLSDGEYLVDGAHIALKPGGPHFISGPLYTPRRLLPYDTLVMTTGAIRIHGFMPPPD